SAVAISFDAITLIAVSVRTGYQFSARSLAELCRSWFVSSTPGGMRVARFASISTAHSPAEPVAPRAGRTGPVHPAQTPLAPAWALGDRPGGGRIIRPVATRLCGGAHLVAGGW